MSYELELPISEHPAPSLPANHVRRRSLSFSAWGPVPGHLNDAVRDHVVRTDQLTMPSRPRPRPRPRLGRHRAVTPPGTPWVVAVANRRDGGRIHTCERPIIDPYNTPTDQRRCQKLVQRGGEDQRRRLPQRVGTVWIGPRLKQMGRQRPFQAAAAVTGEPDLHAGQCLQIVLQALHGQRGTGSTPRSRSGTKTRQI